MKASNEMRALGIGGTVIVWGVIGLVLFLQAAKGFYTGQEPDLLLLGLLLLSVLTVLGTLLGDKPRRAIGTVWVIIAAVGLLFFIGGAGLSIEWMLDKSMGMLASGLITARLIFLPDDKG